MLIVLFFSSKRVGVALFFPVTSNPLVSHHLQAAGRERGSTVPSGQGWEPPLCLHSSAGSSPACCDCRHRCGFLRESTGILREMLTAGCLVDVGREARMNRSRGRFGMNCREKSVSRHGV